jgi:hypothetical protein
MGVMPMFVVTLSRLAFEDVPEWVGFQAENGNGEEWVWNWNWGGGTDGADGNLGLGSVLGRQVAQGMDGEPLYYFNWFFLIVFVPHKQRWRATSSSLSWMDRKASKSGLRTRTMLGTRVRMR